MKVGEGMVPMDIAYALVMWLAGSAGVYASVRLGQRNSQRSVAMRWVMSLGFLIVAAKVTMTLIRDGDLPISAPAAVGHFMVCIGYIGLAIDRVKTERRRGPRRDSER